MNSRTQYVSALKREWELRSKKNPAYSLRAFSRHLGISPSRLSEVLRLQQGLSENFARKISSRLGWTAAESRHFCDLVTASHSRNSASRAMALARIQKRERDKDAKALSEDSFQLISEWYHLAILELASCDGLRAHAKTLSKHLKIGFSEAQAAVERLSRLGLLVEKDGFWIALQGKTTTQSKIPSQAIRNFHRGILEKAAESIDEQTLNERDLSAMIISIDPKDLKQAKLAIREFRRNFTERFEKRTNESQLYCLGNQLFRLGIPNEEKLS
jgi:uncharacterized protein (TIGR02147 family)